MAPLAHGCTVCYIISMKLFYFRKSGVKEIEVTPLCYSERRGYGVAAVLPGEMYSYYVSTNNAYPFTSGIAVARPVRKGKDVSLH